MTTESEYPFTLEQYQALNPEQRQAIEAVADYLSGGPINQDNLDDQELTSIFNLLKPCNGCAPVKKSMGTCS